MDEIIRFSVSLPKPLLNELDNRIEEKGYVSRSEFIRDMIREKMVQDSWNNEKNTLIGVLTLIYEHHHSDLVLRMLELQHVADIEIICTTHIHLNHENCLETLVLKGRGKKIKKFCDRIGGLKGVKLCELTKTAVTHS
ncbi:nickel responsive regulator [Campylobacter pinnipediorum subsp. pinnipediorum]|uniref:nickel-responsive transcriptional regulator NikR n=1 Tax=Campylobacter pinnipediorum TaxID=1965231 RepID=UPI0009955F28|nr:nickel-responsive transcriptional regulator NikR [Campylobacter pinnipediorum]OPA77040.1 nickel responsive regulator [Campylobacter pinnipediorum subsp. pinnipediorum]